jgi:hypothetical protein
LRPEKKRLLEAEVDGGAACVREMGLSKDKDGTVGKENSPMEMRPLKLLFEQHTG